MTDKIQLGAGEWRALVFANTSELMEFCKTNTSLSKDGALAINAHLDRLKYLVAAWHAATPETKPNGEDKPHDAPKRRGRPKKIQAEQAIQ